MGFADPGFFVIPSFREKSLRLAPRIVLVTKRCRGSTGKSMIVVGLWLAWRRENRRFAAVEVDFEVLNCFVKQASQQTADNFYFECSKFGSVFLFLAGFASLCGRLSWFWPSRNWAVLWGVLNFRTPVHCLHSSRNSWEARSAVVWLKSWIVFAHYENITKIYRKIGCRGVGVNTNSLPQINDSSRKHYLHHQHHLQSTGSACVYADSYV